MKKRNLLMMFVAIFGIATSTLAQVPSYVPSNGLLGWWPFNGNANDESGNGNNGTVNTATLTTDRFGNANKAYSFNGINNNIFVSNSILPFSPSSCSFSFWFNSSDADACFMSDRGVGINYAKYQIMISNNQVTTNSYASLCNSIPANLNYIYNTWIHVVVVKNQISNMEYLYMNSILVDSTTGLCYHNSNNGTYFGVRGGSSIDAYYSGLLDDIGIWNRALTQTEIKNLYNVCTNPSASIAPQGNTTFCTGGSVQLNANTGSNFTYQWFNNGALINNATASIFTATQAGSYTVEVNDNGCKALSSPVLVTVNNPPSNVVNASGPTTFCSGNSITLTAQGSGTYLWNTGATTQYINVSQAGSYSVTVTANTCSSNSQAIQVTVNTTPLANITPSGPTSFCSGGFVTLTASGGGTYQWNTGSNASAITVNQMGNFVVTVAANGCTANASQQVTVNPSPNVSLSSPGSFIILSASPVVLSGSPSGGVYAGSGVGTNMFYPANAGLGQHTLSYTYTNNFGCIGSATQSTLVYDTLQCSVSTTDTLFIKVAVVGITPPNNISTIKVFPNPTNDHITIDYGNYLILNGYTMKITNSLGQLVYVSPVNQASQFLSLASWGGSGLYYVYLLDPQNNTVSVKEIVLQ